MLHDDDGSEHREAGADDACVVESQSNDDSTKPLPYDIEYEREFEAAKDRASAHTYSDDSPRAGSFLHITPRHFHDGKSCHYVHGRCDINVDHNVEHNHD